MTSPDHLSTTLACPDRLVKGAAVEAALRLPTTQSPRWTVRHQLYRGVFKDSAKTPAGDDRVIPMLPFLREELLIAQSAQSGGEGDRVLVDEDGVSLTADQILKQGIYKTATGYQGLTTHTLRHWFVSTLTWAGVPRNVIKDIVGHEADDADDVTTLYTHAYSREETFAMVLERCATIGFGNTPELTPVEKI